MYMCIMYMYLVLWTNICSLSEEDLSCLCVSILSCIHESCLAILTRGDGGEERTECTESKHGTRLTDGKVMLREELRLWGESRLT